MMYIWPRFLKSDLYKDSLLADMGGSPLPYNGVDNVDPEIAVDIVLNDSIEVGVSVG